MWAVSVRAPAAQVWPGVAQIGRERGGLYSYELLENIARCEMHNADQIVPEWQLKTGDAVRLGPKGYPLYKVVEVQPNRALVMAGADLKTEEGVELSDPLPQAYANSTWTFVVDQRADGVTRLMWRWLTHPIGFVMTRKMSARQYANTHLFKPLGILLVYAAAFFGLAVWRFKFE